MYEIGWDIQKELIVIYFGLITNNRMISSITFKKWEK